MNLEFAKPLVPNFIRTKQGNFALSDLSEEELTEYAELFCDTLRVRYEEQKSHNESQR